MSNTTASAITSSSHGTVKCVTRTKTHAFISQNRLKFSEKRFPVKLHSVRTLHTFVPIECRTILLQNVLRFANALVRTTLNSPKSTTRETVWGATRNAPDVFVSALERCHDNYERLGRFIVRSINRSK